MKSVAPFKVALLSNGWTGWGVYWALLNAKRDKFILESRGEYNNEKEEYRPPLIPTLADFSVPRDGSTIPYDLLDGDILIAAGWRDIIPKEVLDRFQFCLNVHAGDLPKYAGRRPVQRMIEDGCSNAVISVHEMTEKVDAGRVVARVRLARPAHAGPALVYPALGYHLRDTFADTLGKIIDFVTGEEVGW